ncbi:MAG TPA: hypothetical protein DCS97_04085 [Planctomycetes bacterium]|nr:hypothetical protein [Planctomycetota bacterium]
MSSTIAIADAIVALMITGSDAGWFPLPIGLVERRWAPDWQISDVATTRIGVIARSRERDRMSRLADVLTVTVDVAIMRHLPATATPDPGDAASGVDSYVALAESVHDILAKGILPDEPTARLISLRHEPLVDDTRLVGNRIFFSVLTTTWRYQADARTPLPVIP